MTKQELEDIQHLIMMMENIPFSISWDSKTATIMKKYERLKWDKKTSSKPGKSPPGKL